MKTTIFLMIFAAFIIGSTTYAVGYSGGGGNRGFVSKTGFVKARTNEENRMGKSDQEEKLENDGEGDVPAVDDEGVNKSENAEVGEPEDEVKY